MNGITVVIPAYNEAKCIAGVVKEVNDFFTSEKLKYEIVIVDDCSTDNTKEAAIGTGAKVISHPVNRGYGAALATGIKAAAYEWVMITDADGTYPIKEAKKLLPYVGAFDMVVGARQGRYYHGSPMKRLSRIIFYLLLNYVTAEKVPDANSGLRIFNRDVVMKFEEDFCNGFSFTTTITLILLSNSYLVKFVPVEYASRTGKSKVRYLRDTARTAQILIHAVIRYNPIKAFLPFSVLSFFIFFIFTGLYIFAGQREWHGLSAVISFYAAMSFLGLGMLSYAFVKRGIGKR